MHLHTDAIVAAACAYYHVDRSEIRSQRRHHDVVNARAAIAGLMYSRSGASMPDVADVVRGNRGAHATIFGLLERYDRLASHIKRAIEADAEARTQAAVTTSTGATPCQATN